MNLDPKLIIGHLVPEKAYKTIEFMVPHRQFQVEAAKYTTRSNEMKNLMWWWRTTDGIGYMSDQDRLEAKWEEYRSYRLLCNGMWVYLAALENGDLELSRKYRLQPRELDCSNDDFLILLEIEYVSATKNIEVLNDILMLRCQPSEFADELLLMLAKSCEDRGNVETFKQLDLKNYLKGKCADVFLAMRRCHGLSEEMQVYLKDQFRSPVI